MGQRGPKKRNVINTTWNEDFAYAIGLLVTDGNLSPDKRHLNLTSKDEELILSFKKILRLKNKVGRKGRGGSKEKNYFVIQFGSVQFYAFLLEIGLMPAKSKKLKTIKVPNAYFWNFLRGCLDGDGNINEFAHPESKHLQLRLRFASASRAFLEWELELIKKLSTVEGGWIDTLPYKSTFSLNFGKEDSIKIFQKMYRQKGSSFLKRKYTNARKYLGE